MHHIRNLFYSSALFLLVFSISCQINIPTAAQPERSGIIDSATVEKPKLSEIRSTEIRAILKSATEQIKTTNSYTQKYYSIPYPNGDVPKATGACTDVVIRSFRGAGIDLQKEVHEDMRANFSKYPSKWGLRRPDTNIDHRRVPNLQRFFDRKGKSLPLSQNGENYKPGDVVSWDLNGKGLTHIGVVSNIWNKEKKRYLIIHNIGSGTELEDVLFEWKMTGHYRYF
ncbi:MAG: DUF1287 domain-containing protein [Pyrinomonadaceae bacterium]|nr:DUF1287 domain-containing protein [Pyrinomonadaceae bacterium]